MPGKKIQIFLEVLAVADKSLRVSDGATECWLPKSEIEGVGFKIEDIDRGDEDEFLVAEWLAKNEGLI